VAGIDLAELVDRKVHDQLAEMNGRLEQLVHEAVGRELDRLVHDLVEQNLEDRTSAVDDGEVATAVATSAAATTKVCASCGQEKGLDRFERHRGTCKECRNAAARRRAIEQEPATPFGSAGSGSPTSPPADPAASSVAS
jgi:hypothetical protein